MNTRLIVLRHRSVMAIQKLSSLILLCVCGVAVAGPFDDYELSLTSATVRKSADISEHDKSIGKLLVREGLYSDAFTNFGSGDVYYLLDDNVVSTFNLTTKQLLGSWPLTWWPSTALEPSASLLFKDYTLPLEYKTSDPLGNQLGCLSSHILRYGDLNRDGLNELVILPSLNEYGILDFVVFSPTLRRVVFSARLSVYDAKPNQRQTLEDGEVESQSVPLANRPDDGKYLSRIAEEHTSKTTGVAHGSISLGKLFFGDFDNDAVFDIMVWRKHFRSRNLNDPVPGFQRDEELFVHYKLDAGEYKKQPTETSTIRGWLASKNLTWQKGYPNNSECANQTTTLIPEFHDPLLNDPEVLQ